MIVDELAEIRYYVGDELRHESATTAESEPGVRVRGIDPEEPHSIENTDQLRYHAFPQRAQITPCSSPVCPSCGQVGRCCSWSAGAA